MRKHFKSRFILSILSMALLPGTVSGCESSTANAYFELKEKDLCFAAKKLGEIISRLQDELVKIELNGATATITCKNSKFSIIGISANEFPAIEENITEEEKNKYKENLI